MSRLLQDLHVAVFDALKPTVCVVTALLNMSLDTRLPTSSSCKYNISLERPNGVSEYAIHSRACLMRYTVGERDCKMCNVSDTLYILWYDCRCKWLAVKRISLPLVSIHLGHSEICFVSWFQYWIEMVKHTSEERGVSCTIFTWKIDHTDPVKLRFLCKYCDM
jgi:hypothetical protein